MVGQCLTGEGMERRRFVLTRLVRKLSGLVVPITYAVCAAYRTYAIERSLRSLKVIVPTTGHPP
ncbi:hypothetical protein EC912_101176 [Luteibacter rhizovicinus]|uniref:Uncharacterized protein n=1 Tax=Luteibacter rhizovicinus TaxID=242606 RepID=A0A4R3YWX2_9GAMM|nr:hypothetical protein EC912_101176 [Luteibacter rhizovicinus]